MYEVAIRPLSKNERREMNIPLCFRIPSPITSSYKLSILFCTKQGFICFSASILNSISLTDSSYIDIDYHILNDLF